MRHRILSLSLALLLLITQQLGAAHLLSHVLHPGGHGPATWALAEGGDQAAAAGPVAESIHGEATHADAGDALCQVCLVLATLVAAALPALWAWRQPSLRAAAPALAPAAPAAPGARAPYNARGPPGLPALI